MPATTRRRTPSAKAAAAAGAATAAAKAKRIAKTKGRSKATPKPRPARGRQPATPSDTQEPEPADQQQQDTMDVETIDLFNAMNTADLMDKAVEMGIAQTAIEDAMAHAEDQLRRAQLIELIMNPEVAEISKLSDEQRATLEQMTATSLSKLRKHLVIPQGEWAQAVATNDCMPAMRKLVARYLAVKEPEQIDEALATVASTVQTAGGTAGWGQKADLEASTKDTPRQVAEALVAGEQQELMRAKGSAVGREGHIASAKMLKTVTESGGSLPAPQAMNAKLGESYSNGTSLTAWVEREPVGEPPSDWEGVGPRVKSAKMPKKFRNIFLPLQFDRERDYSISELLDDIEDESEATRYDTGKAKELKTEEAFKKLRKKHVFNTLGEFRDAVDRLEHYCAHTQPAILPPMSEELEQHRIYVRGLVNEMRTAGVDEDPVIMKLYVLYDEEIRTRRAKHTVHTAWTDEFAKIRKTFLTTPLRAHERKTKAETEIKMKRLAEQIGALSASVCGGVIAGLDKTTESSDEESEVDCEWEEDETM